MIVIRKHIQSLNLVCRKDKHECAHTVYHHAHSGGHTVYFFAVWAFGHGPYAWIAGGLAVMALANVFFKFDKESE